MSSFIKIFFTFILLVGLFEACITKDVNLQSASVKQFPPSLIYADDDSTILGSYSNVNKQDSTLGPYFCASLENDLNELLHKKGKKGTYIYSKKNGEPYDIYQDELKVYTTINPTLQEYAENAIQKHLSTDLQAAFNENNSTVKRFPFSNTYNGKKMSEQTLLNIMNRARKSSDRYQNMTNAGFSKSEIEESFEVPTQMNVFSWEGEIDTILTPTDSILYYKNFIRSSLLSIEPSTGHVKAWVGGIDFEHFPFDHVKQGKRQIGSAIKPFTYVTAFSMGVAEPCMKLNPEVYCVEPCEPRGKMWCPRGVPSRDVKSNFTYSGGGINVSMMSLMGACTGPQTLAKIFKRMNIEIPENQVVPSICLGTADMSLIETTSAYATFINNGSYTAPQTIRRIEDKDGNVIYSSKTISRNVFNEIYSYDILQMMQSVVTSGTSTSLKWHEKWGGITHPTAGKTGTTQGNSDMWFFGLTPDLVTGVWTGGEDKQVRFRSMKWGQGSRGALPIYGYYMQSVYADSSLNISTEDFTAPESYDPARFNCE